MAAILVCVDVVENDQRVAIETGGDGLSCRPIDDVKEGLEQKGWSWGWIQTDLPFVT